MPSESLPHSGQLKTILLPIKIKTKTNELTLSPPTFWTLSVAIFVWCYCAAVPFQLVCVQRASQLFRSTRNFSGENSTRHKCAGDKQSQQMNFLDSFRLSIRTRTEWSFAPRFADYTLWKLAQTTNGCYRFAGTRTDVDARLSVGLCVYWRRGNRSIHQLRSVALQIVERRFWCGDNNNETPALNALEAICRSAVYYRWSGGDIVCKHKHIGISVMFCLRLPHTRARKMATLAMLARYRDSQSLQCIRVICVRVCDGLLLTFAWQAARINADDSHARTHTRSKTQTKKKSDASNTQWPILQYESEMLVIIVCHWMSLVAWCAWARARLCVCLWLSTKLSNQLLLSVYACMWVCLCFYVDGYIEFQTLAHRQQQFP